MLQVFGFGSASLVSVFAGGSLAALSLSTVLNGVDSQAEMTDVPLVAYIVAQIAPLVAGTELILGLVTILIPLTGRMGEVTG